MGIVAGDIVWASKEAHAYVAHVHKEFADSFWQSFTEAPDSLLVEPWMQSVVGSADRQATMCRSFGKPCSDRCCAKLESEDGGFLLSTPLDVCKEGMSTAVQVRHGLSWRRVCESTFSKWIEHS